MDTVKTVIVVGGVAVGAYILYSILKPTTTTAQTVDKFEAMGFNSYLSPSGLKDNTGAPPAFVQSKIDDTVTTYKFNTGDYDKLNFAQKFLLSTRLVPAEYVLG
jgi:hypothetical protein